MNTLRLFSALALLIFLPSASALADTPALTTYSNSRYEFSVQYPKELSVKTDDYNSSHPLSAPPIAYIFMENSSVQTEGYVTMNVGADSAEVANCTHPGKQTVSVSINSIPFSRLDDLDESGVDGMRRNYSVIHNNLCYSIEVSSFASACVSAGCLGTKGQRWSLQTEKKLFDRLDHIVQTFRFEK